jgi:ubiquinone/menaquinone biosynthesis C-methylase UbiE
MKKKWTGERLETFIYNRDSIEHLHRYAIVNNYIKDKIVLDIACGEGYGSNLMSDNAAHVYGVDIDNIIIQEAKLKYKKENLEFINGSATEIPVEDNSIDIVVSFETLEHHDKHHEMMLEIKRVLKVNGILIISTPDKFYYSDNRKYNNPFHIKELYREGFVSLLSNYFSEKQLLLQKYNNGNSIIIDEKKLDETIFFSGDYSKSIVVDVDPMYLISIASDVVFQTQYISFFDGSLLLKNEVDDKIKEVYSSYSFKIGAIILFPLRKLKNIFR